jgi:cytochrome c-type biogenesis protein CcmH
MTFWIIVASIFVAAAWAFGVWWVINRVMESGPQAAGGPSTTSAKGKWFAIAAAISVGVALFAGIWNLVTAYPDLVDVAPRASAAMAKESTAADASVKQTSGDLNVLLKRLEDRMATQPDDAEGWALLARSYMELKRYPEAAATYAKATAKLPKEASLWVEYVDAEVMANERKWTPAATKAIASALKLAPENPKALWLAGTERFEIKDYKGAVKHWEVLAQIAPNDSEYAKEIRPALLEAKALAEGRDPRVALQEGNVSIAPVGALSTSSAKPVDDRAALFSALRQELQGAGGGKGAVVAGSAATATANGPRVAGKVDIDPALRAQVKEGDTLFVFARAEGKTAGKTVNGTSNTPVAVAKYAATNWPVAFSLTDQNSMSREASLSTAQQVKIVARISHSGDAKAAPGDLEGISGVTGINADNIQVVIKRILP